MKTQARVYRFGTFTIDTLKQQLCHDGEMVPVSRKVYELLQLLVENAGEIVTRDQIQNTIWAGREIEDGNIGQHIHMLRRTLGDNSRTPKYVLTIPGKGFIFNHPVDKQTPNDEAAAQTADPAPPVTAVPLKAAPPLSGTGRSLRRHATRFRLFVCLLLLVIPAAWWARHIPGRLIATPATKSLIPIPLVTLPGTERYPSFSANERYLAFTSEGENRDNQDIYVKDLDSGSVTRITSSVEIEERPVWSPDGKRLAFLRFKSISISAYGLTVVSADGKQTREIGTVNGGLDWSPDGRYLAVSSIPPGSLGSTIELISVDGTERRFVCPPGKTEKIYDHILRFSPDGTRIAFIRWESIVAGELCVVSLADGRLTKLTSDHRVISDLAWSPDGRSIIFASNRDGSGRMWEIPVEGGTPILLERLPNEIEHFALARQRGQMVFTQSGNDSLIEIGHLSASRAGATAPATQTTPCRIDSSRIDSSPRLSPDGRTLVFVSKRSGVHELWLANSDCTNERQLTSFHEANVGSPRWSPDGSQIVYDRVHDLHADIYTISVDGKVERRLTNSPAEDNMPAWSADGRSIYFTSNRSGTFQIWKIPSSGGVAVQVTVTSGREAMESADGQSLYYTVGDSLWLRDLKTGRELPVSEMAGELVGRYWDLTPAAIFYAPRNVEGEPTIWRIDLATRQKRQIMKMRTSLTRWLPGISVTADERTIASSGVTYRFGDILIISNWQQ